MHVNEQLENVRKISDHNQGVLQRAFFRQDVVGEAVLLIMKDLTASLLLLAGGSGLDLPVLRTKEGELNQDEYFTQAHANVLEQIKQQEEAKARGDAPAQKPLIAQPGDDEVAVFGGDYENSGTTDTEERQATA